MSDGLSREKKLSEVLEEAVLSASEVKEKLEVIDDRVAPSGAACAACALAVPTSALARTRRAHFCFGSRAQSNG